MNDNPSAIHWSNFVAWLRPLSANVGNWFLNVASYADSSNSWIFWFSRIDPTNANHAIRVGNSLFQGCCLNVALNANSSEFQVILSDPANANNQQFVGAVLLFFLGFWLIQWTPITRFESTIHWSNSLVWLRAKRYQVDCLTKVLTPTFLETLFPLHVLQFGNGFLLVFWSVGGLDVTSPQTNDLNFE